MGSSMRFEIYIELGIEQPIKNSKCSKALLSNSLPCDFPEGVTNANNLFRFFPLVGIIYIIKTISAHNIGVCKKCNAHQSPTTRSFLLWLWGNYVPRLVPPHKFKQLPFKNSITPEISTITHKQYVPYTTLTTPFPKSRVASLPHPSRKIILINIH